MSLVASFAVSQAVGEPSVIILTDTSTGSDGTITGRRVYLRDSLGVYIVPTGTTTDYVLWDYDDASIEIDMLDEDMALSITVEWFNVSLATVYSAVDIVGMTAYSEDFSYNLTTMLAANPLLVNDNAFRKNKSDLRVYIDSGNQAILASSDIVSAQLCYNLATTLRLKSEYYFNESSM